jgi:hypothetical protein
MSANAESKFSKSRNVLNTEAYQFLNLKRQYRQENGRSIESGIQAKADLTSLGDGNATSMHHQYHSQHLVSNQARLKEINWLEKKVLKYLEFSGNSTQTSRDKLQSGIKSLDSYKLNEQSKINLLNIGKNISPIQVFLSCDYDPAISTITANEDNTIIDEIVEVVKGTTNSA